MKKNIVRMHLLLLSILAAIFVAANIQAAQIQGVTIAGVSSQLAFPYSTNSVESATNLVTSTGLYGDEHAFLPGGCMWLTQPGANGTNFVTFNLGGIYTVNGMKVWNFNDSSFFSGASGRILYGVSNAVISYSTDGITFTTNIASQNFTLGIGNSYYSYAQNITFPAPVTAQYIRFNIKTNWAGNANGVGLAKVRFVSNTNPPAVLSASENFGSNQVTVIFSESVSNATATSPANYSLSCSGAAPTITGITMGEYQDRVVLSTTPLTNSSYTVSVSGVYDEASTHAVTNNSTVPVQSEVFLRLSADQGVTTSSSIIPNMVTAWNDQSSYAHNAASANFYGVLTNGPVLVPGVINGKPVLRFYGTNVLQIPNDAANPINGDFTVFLVASPAANAAQGNPICKEGGGSTATSTNNLAAPLDFAFLGGSLKPSLNIGNSGALGTSYSTSQALPAGTFSVTAVSITGTNNGQQLIANLGQMIVNGSSPMNDLSQNLTNRLSGDLLLAGAPQDAGNPISIGARNDSLSPAPYIGDIAEVIWIRGTITPNDLTSIENYLAAKYAISPVSITEQPAGVSVSAGNRTTFWVGASGMQPYTYQWYSNSIAVPGATGMTYTTPFLTSSANGASYTVGVTNASGGTLSSPANLTVVASTSGPVVNSATKTTSTNVLVVFSEAVDSTTSLSAANYSIDGGVSVTSVAAGSSSNQVVLTTSAQNATGLYHVSIKNVQDQYANPMTAVTVPAMPSDLTMWLRADSGVVTNPAASTPGAIDAWLDQTANGNNAQTYAIGAGYRPTFAIDPANGKPAVNFAASLNQFLDAPGSPGLNMVGDMTIYMVINVADIGANRSILSKAVNGTRACSYDLYYVANAGTAQTKWNRGDGTSYHTGTETPNAAGSFLSLGVPTAYAMVHQGAGLAEQGNAGNGFEYVNGVSPYNIQFATATFADYGRLLVIGCRGSYDQSMNGYVAEMMIFSNAIAGSDRTNIDNYIATKYFVLTNTTPLTNETINAGGSVTFVATPSQGPAHLLYQWQENGTNIPGATSPILPFGPTFVSDNGDQFQLLVIAGSVTNVLGPVTLSVVSVPPVVQNYGTPFWVTNVVAVYFQTPLNPALATNVANYAFNNGTVLSVQLVSPTEVFVFTTPLNPAYTNQLTIQNLQDNFGSTMTLTNLANVTSVYPPLALWLRADQGINPPNTPQNGDFVSEWDDQSTNMNTFLGTGGFEPIYATNAVNGYPALLFNGTNQTFLYANVSSSLTLNGDLAIFAVMDFTTFLNTNGQTAGGEGGGEIVSETDPTLKGTPSSWDYYCYYGGAHGPLLLRGNGANAQAQFAGGGGPPTNTWIELSAMSSGGTETHRMEGRANGSVAWTLTGGTATTASYVSIGERFDGALALNGAMAELIVVGSSVSTYDTDAIETYLGTKYALNSPGALGISKTNVFWPNPNWYTLLQSTTNLSPTAWSTVTNATALINGTNTTALPTSANKQMFYRLNATSQ